MIQSFNDKETEIIWDGYYSKKLPRNIQRKARLKLIHIDSAEDITDLNSPPGNRFNVLKGDRKGQYSISINSQWRICFIWQNGDAIGVEIVDYH